MKFQNVPVGARFIWVKSSEESLKVTFDTFYDPTEDELFCISGSNLYKQDEECELVTKCANCKHYNSEAQRKKVYENHYYCNAEINESNNFLDEHFGRRDVLIRKNPETFSCSLFELLDK